MPNSSNKKVRRRRPRSELVPQIRNAARSLFARKGYAATTREIAHDAGVSETLLFLYFKNKQDLFHNVVSSPFKELLGDMRGISGQMDTQRTQSVAQMTRKVFEALEANGDILRALVSSPEMHDGDTAMPELEEFLCEAASSVRDSYTEAGLEPPPHLEIEIRLAFATIAASVILDRWLFPTPPAREALIQTLQRFVVNSVGKVTSRGQDGN